MIIIKEKYYFYIDNSKSLNVNLIKNKKKTLLIYRNSKFEPLKILSKFSKLCKKLNIKFFIANNYNLAKKCNADGLYISSYNRKFYKNIKKIGSAHNYNEIIKKIRQGCEMIVLSRLFRTDYKKKTGFFNIVKFNLIVQKFKIDFIPLGGIKNSNLLKLNMVNSKGLAIYSEIKKKPVIYNRLF